MVPQEAIVTVLGAGTPMGGDDGVGERIAAALKTWGSPKSGFAHWDRNPGGLGGDGPFRRILVIDSCRYGAIPGSFFFQPLSRDRAPGQTTPLTPSTAWISPGFISPPPVPEPISKEPG